MNRVCQSRGAKLTCENKSQTAGRNCERWQFTSCVAITFSMGMAFVRDGDSAEGLFRQADASLYEAKGAGRNCLRIDEESESPEKEQSEMIATPTP